MIPVFLNTLIAAYLLICTFAIIISVLLSFFEDQPNRKTKKETKSIVETGTMTLFFIVYYGVIRTQIGVIDINSSQNLMISLGLILIGVGTFVNVKGRWELGQNWANQIKIYQDHRLRTSGMYKLVRHPLYASLIWIFFGGSLVFSNGLAFVLNTLVFIPFMYYRAKQEEKLLLHTFPEYKDYQKKVAMFIPRIPV